MKVSQEQRSNNKNKKYNFTIWTYHKVCELGVGKSFGDIALGKDISNRTATVIANEDAVLGSLHKDVYQICIKDAQEKHRKLNIEYVLSQKLFENFNPDIFERYYFNFLGMFGLKEEISYILREIILLKFIFYLMEK